MNDFDRVVAEFMTEYGFTATFIKTLPAIPNDDDGTISSPTEETDIRAIKMELFGDMHGSRSKPSSLIQEGDQMLYVQPSEKTSRWSDPLYIDPTADRVRINNQLWKVVALKEYNPTASDCILYEMYIRR